MIGLLPPHVFGDFNDQFQFRNLLLDCSGGGGGGVGGGGGGGGGGVRGEVWAGVDDSVRTSTVSPRSARRTYSLSLFFKTFKPTALMWLNVVSGSYLLKRLKIPTSVEGYKALLRSTRD